MASASSLMDYYELAERTCSVQISDKHLKDISSSLCTKWRDLPAYLNMETTVVHDMERNFTTEESRRYGFLCTWKERKGSDATYKVLVSVLLGIKCRNEAEGVCKLLVSSVSAQQPPAPNHQQFSPTPNPPQTAPIPNPEQFTPTQQSSQSVQQPSISPATPQQSPNLNFQRSTPPSLPHTSSLVPNASLDAAKTPGSHSRAGNNLCCIPL